MLATLFKSEPVIDDSTRLWILDNFIWALSAFDSEHFYQETKLVLPTNAFYPGSSSSVEQMTQSIFDATIKHAGLVNWPLALATPATPIPSQLPRLTFAGKCRGSNAALSVEVATAIPIRVNPRQINQPQDYISSLVQVLSALMIKQRGELPPGGEESIPQTIDFLSVFLGFGVIFSNTAYQFKGGCGSCNQQGLNRQSALPEAETVYATALFSVIKGISAKDASAELKPHLKRLFKKSYKDISKFLAHEDNEDYRLQLIKP